MTRAVAPPTPAALDAAAAVIAGRLAPTPLVPAPALAPDAHLKLETLQPTGSFKVRGALAALAGAGPGARVVTASAGNHGLGVAWAAAALGVEAVVVVPETASPAKLAALAALPIEVVRHGRGYDEAEAHALALAAQGARYVSPYNDTDVIAGQATLGRELDAQLAGAPVTVVCALGGGGLGSGLGLWAAGRREATVVGVEAGAQPGLHRGARRGRDHADRAGGDARRRARREPGARLGHVPARARPRGLGRHRLRAGDRGGDPLPGPRPRASWPRAPARSRPPGCSRAACRAGRGRSWSSSPGATSRWSDSPGCSRPGCRLAVSAA